MLDDITGEIIANEIEMVRTAFLGSILLVEGEHDAKVYEKFLREGDCQILVAHGKENVLESMKVVAKYETKGILAIVDSDFWRILGIAPPSNDVLTTDGHDIEVMIVNSKAFDRVVKEYTSKTKMKKFTKRNLRDDIFERALPVGILRWISGRDNMLLSFEGIEFKNFMEKDSLRVDVKKLIRNVQEITFKKIQFDKIPVDKQDGVLLSDDEILRRWLEAKNESESFSKNEMCCGHDLIGIFAVGLKKVFGSQVQGVAKRENMEKVFRLAYDAKDFSQSTLAGLIEEWEKSNPPYKVLE